MVQSRTDVLIIFLIFFFKYGSAYAADSLRSLIPFPLLSSLTIEESLLWNPSDPVLPQLDYESNVSGNVPDVRNSRSTVVLSGPR